MEANLPIRIRHANDTDISFIFSSWLKSMRGSKAFENVNNNFFFAGQHKVIEGLLKSCQVLIACNEADPTQLYGYLVFERVDGVFVMHYVYVKHAFRKLGIAKRLYAEAGHDISTAAVYTHRPFTSDGYTARNNFIYNPFLAYYGYKKSDEGS